MTKNIQHFLGKAITEVAFAEKVAADIDSAMAEYCQDPACELTDGEKDILRLTCARCGQQLIQLAREVASTTLEPTEQDLDTRETAGFTGVS